MWFLACLFSSFDDLGASNGGNIPSFQFDTTPCIGQYILHPRSMSLLPQPVKQYSLIYNPTQLVLL